MGRNRIPSSTRGNHRAGHHRAKAAAGIRVVERDGHWHIVGTLRVDGRSTRVRESTGLRASAETWEDADALRIKKEHDVRREVIHGVKPSVPVVVACHRYMERERNRPASLGESSKMKDVIRDLGFAPKGIGIKLVAHIDAGGSLATFGDIPGRSIRLLSDISEEEWHSFVDKRQTGNAVETRERYLNTILALLNWCHRKPRRWVREVPAFDRNRIARKPKHRRARRVAEMTPELIMFMLKHASPHLAGQIAAEWATGARVSSILYGCRLCDYIGVPGKEKIIFRDTKNSETVEAALHPIAAELMRHYIDWRGRLWDREGPLFLTHRRTPYIDNKKAWGGQNKTAFNSMKRRAIKALRKRGAEMVRALRLQGERKRAWEVIAKAKDEAGLIGEITQHWFRHNLATSMLSTGDLRSVMDQGGWLDPKSVLGYAHDVPERRRGLVNSMVSDTLLTRDDDRQEKIRLETAI